ncbi:MAG: redox-regulated ATPase YchF [Spartobacteria bacterium]|nr:redox-regulated ATPase YchF [Spartobacteria bacterium]
MNLGLIGLPQVGKKTIFSLLTGIAADKAPTRDGIAYGMAPVRDPRVDRLSAMYTPKKTKYAEIEIALPPDIQPATARGAAWITPLRNVDALLQVVRAFEADSVFHVEGSVDPARDLDIVETELLLADLAMIETRLTRIEKEARAKKGNAPDHEKDILIKCQAHLEESNSLRTLALDPEERKAIRSLQFLTIKPQVVAFNVGEDIAAAKETLAPLTEKVAAQGGSVVFLSASIEAELKDLEEEERAMFMQDLGLTEPAAHRLSRATYECLGLLSFFTVGPDEVRAWSVRAGAKAPEAAGKIHSDLERGFIRADTVAYEKLIEAGSEKAAREANFYKLNGKDYEVQDGDIIEIRFNV